MEMDVIKYGRCLLAVLLLLAAVRLDAQVSNNTLKKYITITGAGLRVDSFLNIVSRQTGLGFSFNSKKISPAKNISMPKGSYTIAQCLGAIQKVTGIHYAVMNDHIILVDNPPQEKYRLNLGQTVVKKKPMVSVKPKPVVVKKPVASVKPKPVVVKEVVIRDTFPVTRDTVVVKDTVRLVDSPLVVKDTIGMNSKRRFGLPRLFEARDTTNVRSDSSKKQPSPTKISRSKPDRSTYKPGRTRSGNPYNKIYDPSASSFHIGIVALRPDIYDMTGIGLNLQYEKPFANDNWSFTASAGYHMVLGDYTTTKFKNDTLVSSDTMSVDTTLKNFSQIPLSVGIRCYVIRPLYAAFEAGYAIKASDDVSSSVTFAPSLGLKFPIGKNAIDINFKYLYMLSRPTFEKPRLQKGDYGLWSLRVAYAF